MHESNHLAVCHRRGSSRASQGSTVWWRPWCYSGCQSAPEESSGGSRWCGRRCWNTAKKNKKQRDDGEVRIKNSFLFQLTWLLPIQRFSIFGSFSRFSLTFQYSYIPCSTCIQCLWAQMLQMFPLDNNRNITTKSFRIKVFTKMCSSHYRLQQKQTGRARLWKAQV